MLTLLEVVNYRSDTLQLSLTDVISGYIVRDIEGLSPVKATLTSSSQAEVDGAQFQNARRDTRNITITLGLEPDYVTNTVQSLRTDLYKFFMTKSNLQFNFWLDGVLTAVTSGQVESCDNSMFSNDPEVDISIICYDPDFYGPEQIFTQANATIPSSPDSNVVNIDYDGNSDAGIIFTLPVTGALTSVVLRNLRPDGTSQKLELDGGSWVNNDLIIINTIPGQKSVTYARAGIAYPALSYMTKTSDWISFAQGENMFQPMCDTGTMLYGLAYTPKYGGL